MQRDDGPFDWNAPRHALPVDGARLSRQPTAPGLLERAGSASSFSSEGKSTYEVQDADLMAKLDADSILHIAQFLGTAGVLSLCAVCQEWSRVYQGAVLRLRLSLVSLSGAPLDRVLKARACPPLAADHRPTALPSSPCSPPAHAFGRGGSRCCDGCPR